MTNVKKGRRGLSSVWAAAIPPIATLLTAGFCLFQSDSFSLDKIKPTRDFSFQETPSSSKRDIESLKAIISQPYSYLTEGKESYLFLSEDQKYVIKFFKMKRMTPKYWLNYIPFPWLDKKRVDKIDGPERVRLEFFGGLKIAFQQFRYQTGITFLHLFRTQYLKMKVHVKDKEGRILEIPLDQVPFVLQRKATMLPEYIHSLMESGKKEQAVRALCQILELVKGAALKGFFHTNEKVESDYGFIEGRPIYVRSVYMKGDPSEKKNRTTLREVLTTSHALKSWLEKNRPELIPDYEEEVQDLLAYLED